MSMDYYPLFYLFRIILVIPVAINEPGNRVLTPLYELKELCFLC